MEYVHTDMQFVPDHPIPNRSRRADWFYFLVEDFIPTNVC